MFKGKMGPLLCLLLIAMAALGVFGALIGIIFGKILIGAAIGASLPVVWCILAYCFLKGFELLTRGQWG